ncbi:MAG: hypothetical protein VB877_15210 [Pirellulaceae bacterium]
MPVLCLLLGKTLSAQDAPAAAVPAAAVQYQVLPTHPALSGDTPQARLVRSRVAGEIRQMLRGDLSWDDDANKSKFNAWYGQYVFAAMTQPANFSTLDVTRQKFLRQDLGTAKVQVVHDYLAKELTLPQMTSIVRGNFHPAVRYNAMLIISSLNNVEVPTTGRRIPPIPLLDSLVVILDELKDEKQTDAVKLAAWIGVLRHVQLNRINNQIPPNAMQMIRDISKAILLQKEPPITRSYSGHVWMQRRAVDVLVAAGTGADAEIVGQIEALTSQEDVPMSLRLTAARALGALEYKVGARTTPSTAAIRLGALAAVVCRAEMERVANEKKALEQEFRGVGSSGMDEMMEDEGMEGEDTESMAEMFGQGGADGGLEGGGGSNLSEEQNEELSYTKRMLKYRLYYVQRGLGEEIGKRGVVTKTGLFAKVSDAQKPQVQQIYSMLTGILAELEPPEPEEGKPAIFLDRDQLLQKLRKQVRQLEAATGQAAGGAQAKSGDGALPGVGIPRTNK